MSFLLNTPLRVGKFKIPNRVLFQPMEGCDCTEDGAPSALTEAKYLRAAKSGAGTVWFEACAVCPEGRTNTRQMMLTDENLASFRALLEKMRAAAKEAGFSAPKTFQTEIACSAEILYWLYGSIAISQTPFFTAKSFVDL